MPGGDAGSDADQQRQLAQLLGELRRLEVQQDTLKKAVMENRPIVVHPRMKPQEEEEEEEQAKPAGPAKPKYIASGGLAGFHVATDLLQLDFSPPQEAPEEFRAMTFNAPQAAKGKLPTPGEPGSYGTIDPTSRELQMYLAQLQEQQRQMLAFIAAKHKHKQEVREAEAEGLAPPPMPDFRMVAVAASQEGAAETARQAEAAKKVADDKTKQKKSAAANGATPKAEKEYRAPAAFALDPEQQADIAARILDKEGEHDAAARVKAGPATATAAAAVERLKPQAAKLQEPAPVREMDEGEAMAERIRAKAEAAGEGQIKANMGGSENNTVPTWRTPVVIPMKFGKGLRNVNTPDQGAAEPTNFGGRANKQVNDKSRGGLFACFGPSTTTA